MQGFYYKSIVILSLTIQMVLILFVLLYIVTPISVFNHQDEDFLPADFVSLDR